MDYNILDDNIMDVPLNESQWELFMNHSSSRQVIHLLLIHTKKL